ncbi:MAG TPA: TonB-dependent receptor plug domain-containing protein, partial [Ferruginibacter sp.]|nr:TonB-dependent receptor plug domain-containing protein [Ferruginibacter sp.]
MRFFPDVAKYYSSSPRSINVYWDVSLSGKTRNLVKELDFLEKYIAANGISKTTIFLFNQQMQGIIVFNRGKDNFSSIRNYLLSYKYTGATELGNLDFSNVLADAVLLFSDGINSVGKAQPKLGAVQVNFIVSNNPNYYYYYRHEHIIGNTGGSVINLYNTEVKHAVKRIDSAENFLFKYGSANIRVNETFPIKLGNSLLLSGSINQSDNLELFYGNNTSTARSENYFLPANSNCDESTFKKIRMLKAYDSLMYGNNSYYAWQNMVVFGLTERVVTPQTSYLVLERIEDYITYKIAPPKELEQKCAEMNYVYKSEYKIKQLKQFTEQETLGPVVQDYNRRISWWSKGAALIDLNRPVPDQKNMEIAASPEADKNKQTPAANNEMQFGFKSGGTELKEVVVTGAFGIKRVGRSMSSNVQNISSDQLNAIRQTNINNALAGKISGVQVRSQSYAKLGAESMLRLRGENGLGAGVGALYVVDGTIVQGSGDINPDDIEDVTVLQGPAAAALFGPDGANGAIVVNSKKAKKTYAHQNIWGAYKLSSTEDEDYIMEMQKAESSELWDTYLQLEKENQMDVGFYFEMANFFFEKGRPDNAQEIMYNAIELCHGSTEGLKLAAYQYEKWTWFDKAIAVYKGILSLNENNLVVKRDLALAYFQNKNFEAAVKTYYSIITAVHQDQYSSNIKGNALAEMNATLYLHKNEFDISYINHNLIKILPVDLRITLESNYDQINSPQFIEPGNTICNIQTPNSIYGGRYTGNDYYWYDSHVSEYTIRNAPF